MVSISIDRSKNRSSPPVASSSISSLSDAVELRDGLLQRFELANERIHAALAVVDGLGLLENVRGAFLRHHDHAILVRDDDVAGTDGHARALDWDVPGDRRVVADGRARRLGPRIHGQPHAAYVPEI